jgi:folate-binding protein YgfZ
MNTLITTIPFKLVKISGEDASTFLQGQLSCDINELNGQWRLAAFCNPKGRAICLLRIWQNQSSYYALIEQDIAPLALKRLSIYILRSKVKIENCESAQLFPYSLDDKKAFGEVFNHQGTDCLSFSSHALAVIPDSTTAQVGTKITEQALSTDEFITAQVQQGLPILAQHAMEEFIPQMLNLDLIDGISFKKGCYTGQEIIARMHYRGNLKQRMFIVSCESMITVNMTNADEVKILNSSEPEQAKNIGTLVTLSADKKLAIAVLRIESLSSQQLFLANGEALSIDANMQALPELKELLGD